MNDWWANGRQEYTFGAVAMGQWSVVEHMGTIGNGYLNPLDLICQEKLVHRHEK